MREELLPKACCINLIDWVPGEFDINTETFDDMKDGVDFSGTLGYLLDTPVDFKTTMTLKKNVSDIIDLIQETYRATCENSLEEDYYPQDLVICSLIIDTETKRIEVKFLGE